MEDGRYGENSEHGELLREAASQERLVEVAGAPSAISGSVLELLQLLISMNKGLRPGLDNIFLTLLMNREIPALPKHF